MFKNYLKIAWRNLMKSKVFSLINILGLTIGITVCMMIFLYINNEYSFDNFHKKGKNIYRVMRGYDATKPRVAYLSGPYATSLLNEYPNDIKAAVRVQAGSGLITIDNQSFREPELLTADSGFFNLFSYKLLKGNPSTVLKEPGSIVLTESAAKKYFGNADPMGKIVKVDKTLTLKVTGIAADAPVNSHLSFNVIIPFSNYYNEQWFKGWLAHNHFVYVELNDHTDVAALQKKFPAFMDKYVGDVLAHFGRKFDLALTPLRDIYFEPTSPFDNSKHGEKSVVYIFLSIAALILLIASINFMNLSTVRAGDRSKEVGLRKVMGALRTQLIWQFIAESMLLVIISCILSLGLLSILMPAYSNLLGYPLSIPWGKAPLYLFLLSVIIVVGFLAGSYPAFVLSAFAPIESLKGKLRLGKGGSLFRHVLVVIQFSISVFLVIGTIAIVKQLNYVKNKSLGYDKEQSLTVQINNDDVYTNRETFRRELLANSTVSSVSFMSGEPGGFFDTQVYDVEGKNEKWYCRTEFTDFDCVKTLGLKIIAGRDFSRSFSTDSSEAAIINRTAATELGLTPEQAIGKWVKNTIRDSTRRRIVGVLEDFNFLSLKQKMDPLLVTPGNDHRVAVIKIKPGNVTAGVEATRRAYKTVAPDYPFEYNFLDDQFSRLYKKDIRQRSIITIFSGLAIFIACLGLFGLASFTAAKRTKEIGVRKVLGSSVSNIVVLLSKDLLKPVLIANLIAIPLGYWAMHNWLESFAYRTALPWWLFLLAAGLGVVVALLTVSAQAVKAAVANPITSLRSE